MKYNNNRAQNCLQSDQIYPCLKEKGANCYSITLVKVVPDFTLRLFHNLVSCLFSNFQLTFAMHSGKMYVPPSFRNRASDLDESDGNINVN